MSASSKPRSFEVTSASGKYQVRVAQGSFEQTLASPAEAHILADSFFAPRFAAAAGKQPLLIEAIEQHKSLDYMPTVIEQLRTAGVNRSTPLVALGGGIVQDIAAFVSSIYMRGLAWSYSPTTVLGMVDSCIGGKSSINVGPYKNLVGTYHPPDPILIDPTVATTLPRDQFASGLIEAAKICFCRGPEAFSAYLAHSPSITMRTDELEGVILESLHSKKHFIELDEFDKKERLLLNFGHTFGHALEGASHYGIPHGIGVGLGILCSLAFQHTRNIHPANTSDLTTHLDELIRTLPNLAEELKKLDVSDILDRFASDKKHSPGKFTLILVNATGEVTLEKLNRTPTLEAQLKTAITTVLKTYSS